MRTSTLLLFAALLTSTTAFAQSFEMDGPAEINSCVGALFDSGGEGATGYQNNEDLTVTICPDGSSGNSISLDFVLFALSEEGSDPGDRVTIYDGTDTNAPILGQWSGTDSPGIVSATFNNTSGCLTVNFTSNEVGIGVFAAFITCYTPCQPPVANAVMQGLTSPALACQNEVITFDASASVPAPGTQIAQYMWIFDDGNVDSLSGPVVTHAFEHPGQYIVELVLTDNSAVECQNINNPELVVLISTTPNFSATALIDTTVCEGAIFLFDAHGVVPTEYTTTPDADFGDGVYIPDDQTQSFTSTIQFNGFNPGTTLSSISDFVSVCVDMEHSYMGDLNISLQCPNGQSVPLHQQGGAGVFIGDALDTEDTPPVPGTCLHYCWTPNATNGTWVASTANVQPSTVTPGSSVLIPGDYSSVQPLDQLLGCPLNGSWTIRVQDLLGADDGFICSWSVDFAEYLYPEPVTYIPTLGLSSADSVSWSGPFLTTVPNEPLQAYATPTSDGSYSYVFSVLDNFGCTYDTTIVLTVDPAPEGPLFITGETVACSGAVAQVSAPSGFANYVWSNGFLGPNVSVPSGTYTVAVTIPGQDCPLVSEPFVVNAATSPVPVITGPTTACGAPSTLSTTEQYAQYLWSNSSPAATITVGAGTYSVTVTNDEGCSAVSPLHQVIGGSAPDAAFTTDPASPQGIGADVDFLDGSSGNGSPITVWAWEFGEEGTSSFPSPSFLFDTPGNYPVVLTITTADGCQDSFTMVYRILPEAIIIPNVFTPNGDSNNEYFEIQNGEYFVNKLSVYDRWGKEVFGTKNYRNTWRATDVPDGTYYYIFRTEDDGKEYTGHVTILR